MALTGLAGNLGQFIVIYISHTNHKDTEACKNNTFYLKCSKHTLTFFMSILHIPLTCEELPTNTHSGSLFTLSKLRRFWHLSFKTFSSFIVFWGYYPVSCSFGYIIPSLFNTKCTILSAVQYLKSVLWPKTVQSISYPVIYLFPSLAFHASQFLFLRVVFT